MTSGRATGNEVTMKIPSWLLRVVVAVVLLQTLFFKFTGAEESVYIFSTIGAEPWGRYATGVAELVAAVLVLAPGRASTWAPLGALLALGLMSGAIASHLTILGIEVKGDGGLLFALALIVFTSSAALLVMHRARLPILGRVRARSTS